MRFGPDFGFGRLLRHQRERLELVGLFHPRVASQLCAVFQLFRPGREPRAPILGAEKTRLPVKKE